MATIKVNYENVILQTTRMTQAAQACQEQATKLQNIAASLPEYWQGESGTAMQAKCEEWIKEQAALSKYILSISKLIRTTADEMRRADQSLK